MDSFEWNKIIGWVLTAAIAVLGLSIVSAGMFDTDRPEEMAFYVDVPEEAAAGEDAVDPMYELAVALQEADPARGEAVFKKCSTCHTIAQGGANKQGPNLWGVMGRDVGSHPGFGYSDALATYPGAWTWEELNGYIKNPRGYIPGNVMSFAGLSKVEDRANLFAYLNSQGGGLPLPEVPEVLADEDVTDPPGTGPEAAKADDVPEAELPPGGLDPDSDVGGPGSPVADRNDELDTR